MLLLNNQIVSDRKWWGWIVSGADLWYYTEKRNTVFCKVSDISKRALDFLISQNIQVPDDFGSNASNEAWAELQVREVL